MLKNNSSPTKSLNLIKIFLLTSGAGLSIGMVAGLSFSALNGWDRPGLLLWLGGAFGVFIGFVCGLASLIFIKRQPLGKSKLIIFSILGIIAGACAFSLFGDGLAMAVYLALEGAILGLIIGFGIGAVLVAFGKFLKPKALS